MNDIFEDIQESELTEDLLLVAQVCGMAAVRELLRNLAGISFYIPKITRFDRFIDRYLSENRDKSIKTKALELGVSDQYLRNRG